MHCMIIIILEWFNIIVCYRFTIRCNINIFKMITFSKYKIFKTTIKTI